jgi:hypothetical protein
MSTLQAAPPAWSAALESGCSESFALESISQTQTMQQSASVSAHVDREAGALGTLREVGDEELAGV